MIAPPVNVERARASMADCGIDAIIAVSPLNIGYFTGHFVWLDGIFKEYMVSPGGSARLVFPGFGIFPGTGEPALVVHVLFAASAAGMGVGRLFPFGALPAGAAPGLEGRPTDEELQGLVTADHPTQAVEALARALAALGLDEARLGVEAEQLDGETRRALSTHLPRASVRDCTSLIRLIRAVKTGSEIRALERSADVAERAAAASLLAAAPDVRLGDLVASFQEGLAAEGAALDHLVVGRSGLGITTDPDYRLSEGEVTLVDFGCIRERYFSDSGTTFALGRVDDALAQASEALVSAIERGAAALRPARRGSEVSAVMSESLEADRIVGCTLPHGHGLGLEVRDYPILVPDNGLRIRDECVDEPSDLALEEGMVIALEVSLHVPSVGSLHEERTYVVDRDRGRPLVAYVRETPMRPTREEGTEGT